MTTPLHIQLAIEVERRKCLKGEVAPLEAMARLIQQWPSLAGNTSLGLEHPLAPLVMLDAEGTK